MTRGDDTRSELCLMTRGERNGTNASAGEPPAATLEQRPQVLSQHEPLDRYRRGQGFSGDVYRLRGRRARPDCYFRCVCSQYTAPKRILMCSDALNSSCKKHGTRLLYAYTSVDGIRNSESLQALTSEELIVLQ